MSEVLTTEVAPSPDITNIVIEDDIPVDNFRSEKQQRLLTEVLYTSGLSSDRARFFIAAANVGLFHTVGESPLVPDVFLSLDVKMPDDWREKKNRTYFIWEFGKPPEVVIEIVSNKEGNELGTKLRDYARIGVWYYIVYDPLQLLGEQSLRVYQLVVGRYLELETFWLDQVGLGVTLWEGEYEGKQDVWLRWCDRQGTVLSTGAERAIQAESQLTEAQSQLAEAEQRAQQAQQRAEQLTAQLRALGIEPDTLI